MVLFPLLINVLYNFVGLVREPMPEDIISIKVFNSSSFLISFLSITSLIYTELRRRGFNVDVGVVEKRNNLDNGKKDYKQLEIDFVVNKGSDKYYIQSAYSIEDNNKKEQELQSLLSVGDNFKKIVIVYDHFIKWQDNNGIIYMSIYDFLLNENSLKEA